MSDTILQALKVLDDATAPSYSAEVGNRKAIVGIGLALVAIVEELQEANRLKRKKLIADGYELE